MNYLRPAIVGLLALATLVVLASPTQASPGATERVSVDSAGNQGIGFSEFAAISGDGRFVAFASAANNLVAGDTNGARDVFVHDRQSGATERVSVDSAGNQGNSFSEFAAISGDGRFVAFTSGASNLVADDTQLCIDIMGVPVSCPDIFVHDRAAEPIPASTPTPTPTPTPATPTPTPAALGAVQLPDTGGEAGSADGRADGGWLLLLGSVAAAAVALAAAGWYARRRWLR